MTFQTAFLRAMPHSVILTAFSGYSTDGYQRPVYASTSSTVRARVVEKRERVIVSPEGQELVTSHIGWVATTQTITQRTKFSFESSTYRIMQVERYPDQDGLHHQKLYLLGKA